MAPGRGAPPLHPRWRVIERRALRWAPPCAMETPRHGLIVPTVPAQPRYGEYFSRRAHRKRRRARCQLLPAQRVGPVFPGEVGAAGGRVPSASEAPNCCAPLVDEDAFVAGTEEYAQLGVALVEVMPLVPDPASPVARLGERVVPALRDL